MGQEGGRPSGIGKFYLGWCGEIGSLEREALMMVGKGFLGSEGGQ